MDREARRTSDRLVVAVVLNAKNKLPRTPSSRNNVSRAISARIVSASNGKGTHSVAKDVCLQVRCRCATTGRRNACRRRPPTRQTDRLTCDRQSHQCELEEPCTKHASSILYTSESFKSPIAAGEGLAPRRKLLSKKYMSIDFETQIAD